MVENLNKSLHNFLGDILTFYKTMNACESNTCAYVVYEKWHAVAMRDDS